MTADTGQTTVPPPKIEGAQPHQLHLALEREGRLDRWIEQCSRFLNPILIKESRQALKSRQFVITFSLVLIAALFWSMLGLAIAAFDTTAQMGLVFLSGFNWILLFPLVVVVPVGAYWSQVAEQQENSMELVTLSTMRPTQIISGKFVSALLQVMIYLSVMAPCICFTYLLRGVSLGHIAFSLTMILVVGISMICLSLFLATAATQRATQAIFLIGLVIASVFIFFAIAGFTTSILVDDAEFVYLIFSQNGERGVFLGFFGFLLMVGTYGLVTLATAVSNITFPTDNRSTRVRLAVLIQAALFTGWSLAIYRWIDEAFLSFVFFVPAIHFTALGMLVVGEPGEMSQRVKRGLPSTHLGKIFLGWLMPGPQRGYFFVMCCLWSIALLFSGVLIWESQYGLSPAFGWRGQDLDDILFFMFVNCAYPTIYVGLMAILASMMRVIFKFSMQFLTLILGAGLCLFLMIMPWILIASLGYVDVSDVPLAMSPSWMLVAGSFVDGDVDATTYEIHVPLIFMTLSVLLINLFLVIKELRYQREQAPERVQQEIEADKPPAPEDIDIFAEDA